MTNPKSSAGSASDHGVRSAVNHQHVNHDYRCRRAQSMHLLVVGRTSSRPAEIAAPQTSQTP